jgi:Family of unknown function (DUF6130)
VEALTLWLDWAFAKSKDALPKAADASDNNTVDIAGMPPGQHKVLIELVNANHQVFPGCPTCSQTVTFTVPETKSRPH